MLNLSLFCEHLSKMQILCNFPAIPQSPELSVCLQIVVQMYLLELLKRELSLLFHRNDKLGHVQQFCRQWVNFHCQFTYFVFANLFKVPIYVISVINE